MASEPPDEYELEKLRAEIQQEKQMKEMLEQSAAELRITVEELEKRYEAIDNEGNEWKTRFETQEEMNQQLERQIIMLQDKVEEAKRNLKDADLIQQNQTKKLQAKAFVEGRQSSRSPGGGADTPKSKSTGITINISVSPTQGAGKTPRDVRTFDDLADANPSTVKTLEKEKQALFSQLRDLEWRLDQESKAYHKANDERKQYVLEINATKGNLDDTRSRQRAAVTIQQRDLESMGRTPRDMGYNTGYYWQRKSAGSGRTYGSSRVQTRNSSLSNIPEDQRILDPKKGPIKKTAAVKSLPSLEAT